ncbi:helix-turn-helix transcriptional regulator [Lentisphaerota bacterium WC36G]|nr:helix-turn-helix domain-containing protein [Lentisphaerae bacterium WC36]
MLFQSLLTNLLNSYNIRKNDLAIKLDVSPTMITYFTNGKKQPTIEQFKKICNYLEKKGITQDELVNLMDSFIFIKSGIDPKVREDELKKEINSTDLDILERQVIKRFRNLNDENKEIIFEHIDKLERSQK